MSNRDSLGFGELLPHDVVEIFAQEKHSTRGQKKRSRSLGRALGWLKGKKRKDHRAKGQSPGLGPALDLALDVQGGHKTGQKSGRQAHPQGNGHAVPKRDDDDKTEAPPMFQENVFIEASRPKYLENLHTEALEGLKMMQQEETNNGVEFQDNESTVSTMTVHTDGEGGGFVTDSTIADTTSVVSVQSSVSNRSSRSGLTRQGSTFRPLNSGKKSEKTKRRRHRKTVGGIPQHVQRELGLDRTDWTVAQRLDEEQLYNGESDLSPTSDAPHPGASAILRETNDVHPLNKERLDQLAAVHQDDLALLHRLGPEMSDGQRPHSLAVPWMTTANSLQQELPSPVMSMSPQAAYMSKIIPNAVLPPSIEVVEISRGRSRNSVRTVSKSSLVLSSPAPSRASSRASTVTSASRNPPDSSGWSNSESSETLVSDSSTISRSSTPKQKRPEDGHASAKEDKISVSSNSKGSKYTSNGKLLAKVDGVKKEGAFARSLSVMKPKRAPPPPSRSYSLHNKMKRRSRDLAEVRINSRESSLHNIAASGEENERNKSSPVPSKAIDSPGYHADTSSLEESPVSVSLSPIRSQRQVQKAEEAGKAEVDALQEKQKPPQDKLSKVISPSSGYSSQDGTPAQSHSSSPRHKRGILAKLQRLFPGSSSAASTAPPVLQPEAIKPDTTVDTVSPSVRALRELFNIPLPPKVHAPPPPPPEVWVHSKRSVELLLGPPVPDNLEAIIRKNPKDRRQQRQSPCASTEGSVKSLVVERKHKNPANGSAHVLETTKVQESGILSTGTQNDRLAEQNVDLKENSNVIEKAGKVRASDLIAGMLVKEKKREERLAASKAEEARKTAMDSIPAISLVHIPPSPSPPPGHHPPHPHTKQTVVVSPESSWPPPPPPMAPVMSDEIDFPLPPPPMFGEGGVVVPVQVPLERSVKVTAEAEPQKTTTSQGIILQPLNIPPPPSYTAPPPPVKVVSPSPPTKKFTPLPPLKEVSPPPPPVTVIVPPTLKAVPPPPPTEVSPPPPPPPPPVTVILPPTLKKVSPPPPIEVSPPPPPPPVTVIVPPTIKAVSPPTEVSPPPPPPPPVTVILPPTIKEVSPSPPTEVSPPPPPVTVILPPTIKEVSPPPPTVVSPPPPPVEVLLLPVTKEVSHPPQPIEISPPPPPKESPPLVQEAPPPPVQDFSVTMVTVVSSSPVKEVPPPLVIKASTLSTEEVSPPSSPTPVGKLTPPKSIPPPPPLTSQPQTSDKETDPLQEADPVSSSNILTPPQSIPPAPPIQPEVVPPNTDAPATQEASPSPPSEASILPPSPEKAKEPAPSPEKAKEPAPSPEKVKEPAPSPEKAEELAPSLEKVQEPAPPPEKVQEPAPSPEMAQDPAPSLEKVQELAPSLAANIPLRPSLPVQEVALIKEQLSPASTETQTPEPTPAPTMKEEPTPVVTPSLLQMVKLRSVSSSPEPPKAPEQPEAEVTMRKQEPSEPVPTSSASAEAPQKPIRRSLIILSPTPTSPTSVSPPAASPPATVIVQPGFPKSQSVLLPPASSSTTISPTKKSPPAMTASPSMNLQEAIRLRTAARSRESPASRLSLHSPTSPPDLHKSPSSTASFIFSKSNKKVVIETRPAPEKKVVSPGVKVPPPVAKKPKSKGKEIETSEETEHTAGQDAQRESIKDAAEKSNGTAGTVEVGETPST